MIRTDTFFEADTPELYEVQANPIIDMSTVGLVRGVISKGDPKDIWQVAIGYTLSIHSSVQGHPIGAAAAITACGVS